VVNSLHQSKTTYRQCYSGSCERWGNRSSNHNFMSSVSAWLIWWCSLRSLKTLLLVSQWRTEHYDTHNHCCWQKCYDTILNFIVKRQTVGRCKWQWCSTLCSLHCSFSNSWWI